MLILKHMSTDMYDIDSVAAAVPDSVPVNTATDAGNDAIQQLDKLSEEFERTFKTAHLQYHRYHQWQQQ
jgi:hypothetical protein